jgi:ABC-type molybdate transport system substrate-binding protein
MKKMSLILITICLVLMFSGNVIAQEGNLTVWVAASPAEGENLI